MYIYYYYFHYFNTARTRWCRDCIHLLIDLTFSPERGYSSLRQDYKDSDALKTELLPHFTWMKGMKSLTILANAKNHNIFRFTEGFVLNWLYELELQSLERL